MMRLPTPYRPEADVVRHHLAHLENQLDWHAVQRMASPWVQAARDNPPPFWAMESLLKEYPISSAEGLALMRLAEALLRVPDAHTAMALTADQLSHADFSNATDPTLTKLFNTVIALSKHLLPNVDGEQPHSGVLGTLGARTVVAATVRAVQLLGRQFVLGQTLPLAQQAAQTQRETFANLRFSYDMLGEGARTAMDAERYLANYRSAIRTLAQHARSDGACADNDGISIKLSALHPRFEDAQRERVMAELLPRVWSLCEQAAQANIPLTLDAEETDRLELSLDLFDVLAHRVARHYPQWPGLGLAMQAYQTRSLDLIEHIIGIARQHGVRLMCRLVKGAYWDAEIKRTQELGLPHYPVFTHKHHTDVSYLACAHRLLHASDVIYPQFATHNAATIAAVLHMAAQTGTPFELQRLHGMGEGIYREVLQNPLLRCRVYAPVGAHKDLLAYLVRRLLENGANASFVHQLADETMGIEALLQSPLRLEPDSALPLPADLFGTQRANSHGLDLTVPAMRQPLLTAYSTVQVPQVPVATLPATSDPTHPIHRSLRAFADWGHTDVAQRAAILRRAADTLQAEQAQFCALLVKEAFKTWGDAVSEVREAIDFLRYYAQQAEHIMQPHAMPGIEANRMLGITGESNVLRLMPRGPWVCISPWNFPLAIFIGQVAAALATGNTVLAKPAEQTPGVALEAVRVLHQAGVPLDALQLLHGPGATVGAALVAAPHVAGVVFTGSTATAKHIQRALAAKDGPIVPLIAETGGINAMLVDSTALPEQVTDAVIQSAFRSAGQRCSALRLLCLHESIADDVIDMIQGAAHELVTGDPAQLATDLGPVIDATAYQRIHTELKRLHASAHALLPVAPSAPAQGPWLIPPQMFEVARISDVQQEIFGPVLHIVRWGSGNVPDAQSVISQINALGFGLTLGIHTRIDSRAQALAQAARIGNVYINRNQIGAIVGVQPFGGEGLSGTGPKAGGPHYLYRFCSEQTVTINTTAAGGNAALLAGR